MSASEATLTATLGDMAAKSFASALLGGSTGMSLYAALWEAFPTIGRSDTFLGATLALSIREADLVAAEIELRRMRALLAERGVSPPRCPD